MTTSHVRRWCSLMVPKNGRDEIGFVSHDQDPEEPQITRLVTWYLLLAFPSKDILHWVLENSQATRRSNELPIRNVTCGCSPMEKGRDDFESQAGKPQIELVTDMLYKNSGVWGNYHSLKTQMLIGVMNFRSDMLSSKHSLMEQGRYDIHFASQVSREPQSRYLIIWYALHAFCFKYILPGFSQNSNAGRRSYELSI